MKVIKFGGSSLANATQLRKVFNIVKSDEKRKIVVVSAPGKRTSDDEKVTDLLIQLATSHIEGDYDELMSIVKMCQIIAVEAGAESVMSYVKINYKPGGEILTIEKKIKKYIQ